MKLLSIIIALSFLLSNEMVATTSISDSLPKNMPLIKNIFWGEKGVLRNSFVDPKSRVKELKIRRNMLQLHQRLALLTLGEMMCQYYLGKKMVNYDWREENIPYRQYNKTHRILG